ncbi:MAG: cell shape determination protein CcmA [Gammaproteobacteria bacterium]|nr:MAG: cell shape determination protein CcmA [Gammaproteobacteria bacterium]RLA17202.1 MAG: cell shape determination protein CcmA [Gammaproteobacteria bacterium]
MKSRKKAGRRALKEPLETLIGANSEINGDLVFSGGLVVEGRVLGNLICREGDQGVLTLSKDGVIEGNVEIAHQVLDGTVIGDVVATEYVALQEHARVTGSVRYSFLEMAVGAEVNGQLVHVSDEVAPSPDITADVTSLHVEVKN